MKELVINQPSKRVLLMLQKMKKRMPLYIFDPNRIHSICVTNDAMYYEIFQKGTYTCCILTIDNEIVGIGMTKRNRNDKYNARVASDVCTHKALKDYLFGIEPECEHIKESYL